MTSRVKIGRNDTCPCGSGLKYKKCCDGKVAWPDIIAEGPSAPIRYLSTRGKNLLFLRDIADALQYDHLGRAEPDFARFKRSFTPGAVRKIFESIMRLWPDGSDLERVLRQESVHKSGLYVGTYEPGTLIRGVTRHSLYSDIILLIDPFLYPSQLRPEHNPVLHPEKYRTTALKGVSVWLTLAPWILAGIVKFIRLPSDFDLHLLHESMRIQEARREQHPELEEIAKRAAKEEVAARKDMAEYYVLLHPDETLRADCKRAFPDMSEAAVEEFLSHIRQRRAIHPFYLDPLKVQGRRIGELIVESSGAAYDMAKRTALLSGSYLITDLEYRWKEIELDRANAKIDAHKWSPFAKAFQECGIKYLNDVPLDAALRLRQQGRLTDMRDFLRKVWRTASAPESFDSANAANLASELGEKVREAEEEWKKIDRDLLKWLGTLGPAVTAIVSGTAGWVPAAVSAAVTGATGLTVAQYQKHSFEYRYPAGFFLKLRNKNVRTG